MCCYLIGAFPIASFSTASLNVLHQKVQMQKSRSYGVMFKISPPIKNASPCELLIHVRAQPRLGSVPLGSLIHFHCFPAEAAANIVPAVNFKIRFWKPSHVLRFWKPSLFLCYLTTENCSLSSGWAWPKCLLLAAMADQLHVHGFSLKQVLIMHDDIHCFVLLNMIVTHACKCPCIRPCNLAGRCSFHPACTGTARTHWGNQWLC